MKTLLFYPSSIHEAARFQGRINSSDFSGEWNSSALRFEFIEESELVFNLMKELEDLAVNINGHFEID